MVIFNQSTCLLLQTILKMDLPSRVSVTVRPTTKVKWSRNEIEIEDQNIYTTSQRILNTSHYPVYENRLIVKRKEGGVYKCEISNCFVIYKPTEGVTEHHSRSDCTCRSNILPVSPMIIYLNK